MNDITTRLIAALAAAQEHVQELRIDRDDRFGQTTESNRSRIAELDANVAELRALRDELRGEPIPFIHTDTVKIVQESLRALPVGSIPRHTPETIPGRIHDLVVEVAGLTRETEAWEKWAVELYGRGIEDKEPAEMRAAIQRDVESLRCDLAKIIEIKKGDEFTLERNVFWRDLEIGDELRPGDRIMTCALTQIKRASGIEESEVVMPYWEEWTGPEVAYNSHHPRAQRKVTSLMSPALVESVFKSIPALRLHVRRHGPPGYDLVDTTVPDPLSHLFQLQAALNARCGVDLTNLSDKKKAEWTLNYTRAMQQEIAELIDSVPWKWWAKYQKFDEQNAKVEVVDLFHFLISLAQVFGMSSTDVYEAYLKKNAVNHKRQDSGYVAKDANDSKHI